MRRSFDIEGKHYLESVFFSVVDKPPKVEVRNFVVTRITQRGDGTEKDPIRTITEVWDTDGEKVGEVDPLLKNAQISTIKEFC